MALKVSQAGLLLRAQLQITLQACAPERGITDWLDEIADDIDYKPHMILLSAPLVALSVR